MTNEYFDAPLFIRELGREEVAVADTLFFCNIDGRPAYEETLPDGCARIEPASGDERSPLGTAYAVHALPAEPSAPPNEGEQTQLEFAVPQVVYLPLEATQATAAAFGMTLVEPGQGIQVSSPTLRLSRIDFEYGMFAGHQSPYLDTGRRLLGVVGTDLECHDFPHVFASIDDHLPLVISVGRYVPERQEIHLADLWLPRGMALYVPPKAAPAKQTTLYLHGNRNSALACWRGTEHFSVKTQTLLQAYGGAFQWFWSAQPSIHPLLA